MYKLAAAASCAVLLLTCGLLACGGPAGKPRGYAKPALGQVLGELQSRQQQVANFVAESRMEYWEGDTRVRPTVLVMGERGAKVRFNALDPDETVAADLACNGADFQFIDFNQNCQLTGPCTKESIGKLLRINLEPDDFLLLAIGQTPLIPNPTGTVRWDAKAAQEILELHSEDQWKQTIVLDGREQRWDVVSSTVWNPQGEVEWKLTNKEFSATTTEDEKSVRVPAKTRFEQPQAKADLSIRWIERTLNTELSPDKFTMQIPALPRCGQGAP